MTGRQAPGLLGGPRAPPAGVPALASPAPQPRPALPPAFPLGPELRRHAPLLPRRQGRHLQHQGRHLQHLPETHPHSLLLSPPSGPAAGRTTEPPCPLGRARPAIRSGRLLPSCRPQRSGTQSLGADVSWRTSCRRRGHLAPTRQDGHVSEGRRVWPHESGTVTEKPHARRRLDVLEPPRHGPGEVLTSWLGYRKTTGWTGTPGMKAPAEKGQEGTTSRLAAADATPSPRASCGLAGQQRPVESPRLCWWKTGRRPCRQAAERVPPGCRASGEAMVAPRGVRVSPTLSRRRGKTETPYQA